MQEDLPSSLHRFLSFRRFQAYKVSSHDKELDVLACYAWNIALNESLYSSLHVVEVVLRNSIHQVIAESFQNTHWLDSEPALLRSSEQVIVRQAKMKLHQHGKVVDEAQLVAQLNFGFWTSLLDARYEQVFWPALLKAAFPAMPRRIRTRKTLSKRLFNARHLRNRVFHHEPIWYWQDLEQQHNELLEIIDWISPVLKTTFQILDRFPEVYRQGRELYREKLAVLERC